MNYTNMAVFKTQVGYNDFPLTSVQISTNLHLRKSTYLIFDVRCVKPMNTIDAKRKAKCTYLVSQAAR